MAGAGTAVCCGCHRSFAAALSCTPLRFYSYSKTCCPTLQEIAGAVEGVLAAPGAPPAALAAAAPNELGLQLQAPAALHAALLRRAPCSQHTNHESLDH